MTPTWPFRGSGVELGDRGRFVVVTDRFGRDLASLRISVTDRCNLRCSYCMPEQNYTWLPKQDLLSFREIRYLTEIFAGLGITRIRLTGGEPLLRRDLPVLVSELAAVSGIEDLALTTNGISLRACAGELRRAGLCRVTISLDTLRPERFRVLTSRDAHAAVLAGIETAVSVGFSSVKINTVVRHGANEDEVLDILEYGRAVGAEVRFIEYMDVGGATQWSMREVVPRREILDLIECHDGPLRPLSGGPAAPAERFETATGTTFGVIASTTVPFCSSCNRSRLTADGHWYRCLYAREGLDLRQAVRAGTPVAGITGIIAAAWHGRTDRGAEERLALSGRGPLAAAVELRRDPRLEMHTRGG